MIKKTIAASLIILTAVLIANVYTKSSLAATVVNSDTNDTLDTVQSEEVATNLQELSCVNPAPEMVATCRTMEREILDTTVRLLMFTPLMHVEGFGVRIINSMGHATIMQGRYLVTHNHYDETLFSMLVQGDPENLITIAIFNTNGEVILQVPGQTLSVLVVDHETVVFDLGERRWGWFLHSPRFTIGQIYGTIFYIHQAGMEVAQIDWDGSSSHIDWVTIDAINIGSETPIINVTNCIKKGASGGGVFWQGQHIGNNWSRTDKCDSGLVSGDEIVSTVALNSQLVMAPDRP